MIRLKQEELFSAPYSANFIGPEKLSEGLAYAEHNFLSDDCHLYLDKQLIKKHFSLKDKDVMDFGCGMGSMSLWMAKEMKCNVDGFDIDENHIAVSFELNKKYNIPNVQFELRDITELPHQKKYDLILLNDVIEHVCTTSLPHVLNILINQNLKEGGILFLSYPPWEGPHASHMQRAINIPWLQYFPKKYVLEKISKNNQQLVGRNDLLNDYLTLNQMTHKKLMHLLKPFMLKKIFRVSHTRLNKIPGLHNANFNIFPFKYLVTKELIAFRKIGEYAMPAKNFFRLM